MNLYFPDEQYIFPSSLLSRETLKYSSSTCMNDNEHRQARANKALTYTMFDNHPNTAERLVNPRYRPCQILTDQHIPYVIWFEDALYHHGVPVAVFDLYLLVQDIDIAAKCLAKAGWTIDMQRPFRFGNAEVRLPQRSLLLPDSDTKTVLLPAEEWNPLTATPLEL